MDCFQIAFMLSDPSHQEHVITDKGQNSNYFTVAAFTPRFLWSDVRKEETMHSFVFTFELERTYYLRKVDDE